MKKTLLFLILLPIFTFSQNYSNFSQSIVLGDLTTTSSGGAGGSISITDNTLTVNFSGGWAANTMKTGVIKYLNITPVITFLALGGIMNSAKTSQTGYFATIENNNLIFRTYGSPPNYGPPPVITGCSLNFTKVFPKNLPANKIKFTYDAEGNQTQRTFCSSCTDKKKFTEKEEIASKTVMEDNISYYPNPVNQELSLSWELTDSKVLTDIQLYTLSGQLLKTYKNFKNNDRHTVSFQDYPEGLYLIVLTYDNTEQKAIKIIKK